MSHPGTQTPRLLTRYSSIRHIRLMARTTTIVPFRTGSYYRDMDTDAVRPQKRTGAGAKDGARGNKGRTKHDARSNACGSFDRPRGAGRSGSTIDAGGGSAQPTAASRNADNKFNKFNKSEGIVLVHYSPSRRAPPRGTRHPRHDADSPRWRPGATPAARAEARETAGSQCPRAALGDRCLLF